MDAAQEPEPMMDPRADGEDGGAAIRAVGVSKQFGDQTAVRDVSFDVPSGIIFGYVGPSGSGKTTTIRMLTGVYPPSAGTLSVLGSDPRLFTSEVRRRLGYLPQHFVLYPDLSVNQNLSFAASVYGMGRRGRRIADLLDFVELSDAKGKRAGSLSGGMQRRLSLAATLVHDPDLLFLDEPTGGIDPVLRQKFWDEFRELRDGGKTLFVTTQYVGEAVYCDLVGVMVGDGRLLAVDTPEGLRRRAFGGDLLEIRLARPLTQSELRELGALDTATGPVHHRDDGALMLPVEEAPRAIPEVMAWASERDVPVETVQEDSPSFDDVFVRLMEQTGASTPREEESP